MRRKLPVSLPSSAIPCSEIDNLGLPEESFLARYIDYASQCTDAPKVYHLGVGLGILAVAAGRCDVTITTASGHRQDVPIRIWSAIVGNSGQRKSEAMDLGVDILRMAGIQFSLPQDASVEAWHDALGANPVALLQLDELSSMFDAANRSWSMGLKGWMLSMWGGRDKDRLTKTGGQQWVRRPRFSVLGGIPQDVLEKKTNRSDWRSGLLPRFCFWSGKRTEWAEVWQERPELQRSLANWLAAVPCRSTGRIMIPYPIIKPINEWFFNAIEMSQDEINPDLFSALTRLQEKAFLFTGLLHLACQNRPLVPGCAESTVTQVRHGHVALAIIQILKQVIKEVFGFTSGDPESKDESVLLDILSHAKKPLTIKDLCSKSDFSRGKIQRLLKKFEESEELTHVMYHPKGKGRPAKGYILEIKTTMLPTNE